MCIRDSLYGDRQLAILDVYGKEQILPVREKVRKAYQEYRDCADQLKALDMDEEQRNREKAFLEFEINEIEEAALIPGEDETLEDRYRKLSNARRIMETAQMVRGMTGYEPVSYTHLDVYKRQPADIFIFP